MDIPRGYAWLMLKDPPVPPGLVRRAEAAAILGASVKRVTNMRWAGSFGPMATPDGQIGRFDRTQVEALAAARKRRSRN
jgi:hypothetical protein